MVFGVPRGSPYSNMVVLGSQPEGSKYPNKEYIPKAPTTIPNIGVIDAITPRPSNYPLLDSKHSQIRTIRFQLRVVGRSRHIPIFGYCRPSGQVSYRLKPLRKLLPLIFA